MLIRIMIVVMYDIKCNQVEPYAESIALFIKQEFPVLTKHNDSQMLDLLTEAIVASGQVRLGPKPSPESLVAIREVITHWTSRQMPIPFLVPWGSEKPDGSGIDVAELFAFKTLNCLQHRVTEHYSPGVEFRIRVEDASAPHLFFERMDEARNEAAHYTAGFVNLARTVGLDTFIKVTPETSMISEDTFNRKADEILPAMVEHVSDPMNEVVRGHLAKFGWKAPLDNDTIGYYRERYAKLYPDKDGDYRTHMLARYFAGALSRHALGITGAKKEWEGKFLELSFAPPTPGISASRALRRLYYRTMPCSITSNHIPAWRAKGFLKINGHVTAALTSFNNPDLAFNPNTITLTDGSNTQEVQADYVIV
jgi:hypothetical protein